MKTKTLLLSLAILFVTVVKTPAPIGPEGIDPLDFPEFPPLPSVPEPTTLISGAALAGLVAVRFVRRKK